MSELTKCAICKETFRIPKCLPCIHTFCLECLEEYGREERPGDEMACPLCQKLFEIPAGGFRELPANFFMQAILDQRKRRQNSACRRCKAIVCSYCVECSRDFCAVCMANTARHRESHNVVPRAELEAAPPRFCANHTDKQLELYCCDCKNVICMMCTVLGHREHSFVPLKESSKKFVAELKENYPILLRCIEANKDKLKELIEDKETFVDEISAQEYLINATRDKLKLLVDMQCNQLIKQLRKFESERLAAIHTRKDDVEEQLMIVTGFKDYVEQVVSKGSACDISLSANALLARAEELVVSQRSFAANKLKSVEVSFTPHYKQDGTTEGGRQLVGQLNFTEFTTEKFVVVLGSSDDGNPIAQRISLDHLDDVRTVRDVPTLTDFGAAACVLDNALYVVGTGHTRNELWKWTEKNDWRRCEDMTSGRRHHCVAVIGSRLYALGGLASDNETALNSVEAFDVKKERWATAGELSEAVYLAAGVAYKNSIYLFGGTNKKGEETDCVEVYRAVDSRYSPMPMPTAMPAAYSAMRAVRWKIFAILVCQWTCLIYNLDSQTWLERKDLRACVSRFGLFLDNQTLYVVGSGADGGAEEGERDDEVRSVCVFEAMEEDKAAMWKHHATTPKSALMHACSPASALRLRAT